MSKDNYFLKRDERIKQKFEILLARPDFQNDIKKLRRKWNISPDGIKTEETRLEWFHWLDNETDQYVDKYWPECRRQMRELVQKDKLHDRQDLNDEFNKKVPRNAFHHEISHIVFKFKLPSSWHSSIRHYLLFNNQDNVRIPLNSVSLLLTWDSKTGERQISLTLQADSTIDDIKAIWPLVMVEQKRLHDYGKKYQPAPNLTLDQRSYELKQKKENKQSNS